VWLSAAIHGDELSGVEVIRTVLETIVVEGLTGAVIAASWSRRVAAGCGPAGAAFSGSTWAWASNVRRGQTLGMIGDVFAENTVAVRSRWHGVVIGRTNNPLNHLGDAIIHVALAAAEPTPRAR